MKHITTSELAIYSLEYTKALTALLIAFLIPAVLILVS